MKNPWASKPLCDICEDNRYLGDRHGRASKCPRCGCTCPKPEKGEKRSRDCMGCKWIEATEVSRLRANPPVLKLADLTEKEAALYRDWRAEGYHEFDCLRWIEGQRYEPIRDAEFLKDAREQFRKWREECAENMLGPLPEWMQRKLAGTPVQTNDEQERFFKLWKEKHP